MEAIARRTKCRSRSSGARLIRSLAETDARVRIGRALYVQGAEAGRDRITIDNDAIAEEGILSGCWWPITHFPEEAPRYPFVAPAVSPET